MGSHSFTFSLGTSAGDLISESSGMGYAYASLLFAGVIALVFLAYHFLNLNGILAFWIAYIFTRPLGSSMGDLLSQPAKEGGLGLGTTVTSGAFLIVILALVIFITFKDKNLALNESDLQHN